MNQKLTKLNCMNYHVSDSNNDHWYAQNGLRSLYVYSKDTDKSFKTICNELYNKGEIILKDLKDNDNDILVLTMI